MQMITFIIRRFFYSLTVFAGVILVIFFLFNILPGDPAQMVLGQRADKSAVEAVQKELGTDLPVLKRLILYINDLSPVSFHNMEQGAHTFYNVEKYGKGLPLVCTGNYQWHFKFPCLRNSYQTHQNVNELLQEALPGTAVLAFSSLLFAAITGIALGIISALNYKKTIDRCILFFSVSGMAIPSFFAGLIIAWLFGYVWSNLTGLHMTGSLYAIDPFTGKHIAWRNLILPALTLGIRPLSVFVQLTRSSMLDVMSSDYIRTAKAKGLSHLRIIMHHALKNALNPVVTAISGWLGSLLAGSVFIEYIFGWKGIGKLMVDAMEHYDFPVVSGIVLLVAFFFLLINMITDIIYSLLDPRAALQ